MTGRSKSVVSAAMKTAKTKEEFAKALQSKAIDVVFRTNDDGRIYGVTFIDHENRVVLNGSRLGKAFSANAFQALFSVNKSTIVEKEPKKSVPVQQPSPFKTPQNQESDSGSNLLSSVIDGVFELVDVLPLDEHYDETMFVRRKRKKKRKKQKHL